MGRGHEAALAGAVRAVAKYGSRATMGDIALIAGIAKATLYNHFRTREELYAAVLIAEIDAVASAAAASAAAGPAAAAGALVDRGAAAVAEAARLIANNPAVRRVASSEPAVLAALSTPVDGPAWRLARERVVSVLSVAGIAVTPAGVDVVVRYLASQLAAPTSDELRLDAATVLVAGLVGCPGTASGELPSAGHEAAEPGASSSAPDPAGSSDTSS
jgi:AcrR family transcriptional regulator